MQATSFIVNCDEVRGRLHVAFLSLVGGNEAASDVYDALIKMMIERYCGMVARYDVEAFLIRIGFSKSDAETIAEECHDILCESINPHLRRFETVVKIKSYGYVSTSMVIFDVQEEISDDVKLSELVNVIRQDIENGIVYPTYIRTLVGM